MAVLSDHFEASAFVAASPDIVFAYADDPARLSSHMSESSWMMGGGRMAIELDAGRGQSVGSRIRLSGRVFGLELSLEEIVTERVPPQRKVWETTGSPKLLVIAHYRMGFEIASQENGSLPRVYIYYALPEDVPARWLGWLFGRSTLDGALKGWSAIRRDASRSPASRRKLWLKKNTTTPMAAPGDLRTGLC